MVIKSLPKIVTVIFIAAMFLGFSAAWQPDEASALRPGGLAEKTGCSPQALLLLKAGDVSEMERAIRNLEEAGGCAVHVFPPRAVIGAAPPDASMPALAGAGVEVVYTSAVDLEGLAAESEMTRLAARLWNENFVNAPPPEPVPPEARPLVFDHFTVQPMVDQPDPYAPAPLAADYYSTALFMAGKVAVGIITPESTGGSENWSSARQDSVFSEIQYAMGWWGGQNPLGGMTFYYDQRRSVSTTSEPISGPHTNDAVWIHETMGNLGYSESTWYTRAYHYLNDIRTTYSADWAVVIYVVDSLADVDGKFSDGYFGYAYSMSNGSGLLVVMTYDNDGWGIANMDKVTAHEIGHIFGAADEYCQPGYSCCWGNISTGYLNVANTSCEAGCDNYNALSTPIPNGICDGNDHTPGSGCQGCPSCVTTNCIMRNNAWAVDTATKGQVGIRDTDGDNILDPLDTTPSMSLTPFWPNPTTDNTPTWNGSSSDVPYDAPATKYTDTTINYLTTVEYQIDGGAWNGCLADDGAFDETSETFSCTPSPLPDGNHTINVRARNRAGNYSALGSDSVLVDATAPTNPTSINPGCAANHNIWQSICPDPNFSWLGASDGPGSGIAGYYYYWGTSSSGTSANWTVAPLYDPPAIPSPSTYYLRIQTKDNVGNTSAWATVFIFKYDASPPSNPTSILPGCTASDNVWQNTCPDPNFSWSGADDGLGSGVAGYNYYWGPNPSGTAPDWTGSASFDPPAVISPSTTYLRISTRDQAGNSGPWITMFTFRFDASPPGNPASVDPGCTAIDDVWQNTCSDPNFTWSGAGDGAGSGVAGYFYYWGSDPSGTAFNWTVTEGFNPSAVSSPSITYLRIQTKDNVGNLSPWITLFTLRYDASPPTSPISVDPACTASSDVWQNTCSDPNFTWSGDSDGAGSGVAGYYYYWGASPTGTSADWSGGANFDAPAATDPSTNYLRVQTVDNLGNASDWVTLFILRYDGTAPDSSITSIVPVVLFQSYQISWGGSDSGSGLLTYDVQYRVGTGGTWTDWLLNTTQTSATFGPTYPVSLIPGQVYYFRVRARDHAGNLETYPSGDGDLWMVFEFRLFIPLTIH